MKKLIIGSLIMLLAISCGKKNQYTITVKAEEGGLRRLLGEYVK